MIQDFNEPAGAGIPAAPAVVAVLILKLCEALILTNVESTDCRSACKLFVRDAWVRLCPLLNVMVRKLTRKTHSCERKLGKEFTGKGLGG